MDHQALLESTQSILLIDYPGRIVPDTLTRAGYIVVAHEGPGPNEYVAYSLDANGEIARGAPGPAPDQADLVFSHRPVDELPEIAEEAARIGARAVWMHSGLASDGSPDPRGCWLPPDDRSQARRLVEAAGLAYLDEPFILDAVAAR